VWLETVPSSFLDRIRWTANLERWEIGLEAYVGGTRVDGLSLAVRMGARGIPLAEDIYSVQVGEVHRQVALSDPGIDDVRNELLWSPSSPTLIDVELELRDQQGQTLDKVRSYTALRTVRTEGNRFILNGRPLTLRMILDQGYWPATGLSAPDDDTLRRDVLLVKKMGFNGVRKHQKIEDPRYLYWADHLGLLVWEEMPSAYRYTRNSVERLTREWMEVLNRDAGHPCIVAWVPFNESWGVPDLPTSPAQRNYVQALYHLTKTLDPARPIVGNDGWESVATDIIGIHDYDVDPERIAKRYGLNEIESLFFKRVRPGGRMLVLDGDTTRDQPIVLSEFGGIALSPYNYEGWGYSQVKTPTELYDRYSALLDVVKRLPGLAGFCYTQFTDTYQETNGLLFADRTPKLPLEDIALVTTGTDRELGAAEESLWRERLMDRQR
jgi:hypothetical protein